MNENLLLQVIFVLLIILVGLWITIGYSLVYRRNRTLHLAKIELKFAEVAAQYLYPLKGEKFNLIKIQRAFRSLGIKRVKPRNVQYLQDLMLRTQRSVLGRNYEKLETLYKQIPPYRASQGKLNSEKWYVKARGIREIYEMDQEQYIRDILKERNNRNIYVRREAQIALVVFLGWDSLRFLPYLKREMTLWQQIRVVEKLNDLYPEPNIKYLREAYNSEKAYATELVMRIIRKFDLREEVDFIIRFLDHPKFDTREAAIYCISSFRLNPYRTSVIKEKFFKISNTEHQVQILKYLHRISDENDLSFYKKVLNNGSDILKLCTAEILWNSGNKKLVQDFYYQQYTKHPVEEVI